MKTERGIYLNIEDSDYTFVCDEAIFYFTSLFNLRRFEERYKEEVVRFNQSLSNVYKNKFKIRGDSLAMVRLYMSVEKRGFYIKMNGVELHCLEDLVFVVTPNSKPKSDD